MVNTVSLKDLRPDLPKVIERIDHKLDRYVVTRRGTPIVVMMSVDDYESLMETLDILSDKNLVKDIKKAEDELETGKGISWVKAKQKLGYV